VACRSIRISCETPWGASAPIAEYLATSRIGEKGQITVPKPYRDEVGLHAGDPVAVLRIGNGILLVPELPQFRLCKSIADTLTNAGATPEAVLGSLPEAREQVFRELYPGLSDRLPKAAKRRRR